MTPIVAIQKEGKEMLRFESIASAARYLKVTTATAYEAVHGNKTGKQFICRGYRLMPYREING